MTRATTDVAALKLHVDRGVVWRLDGARTPRSTGMAVGEFLQRAPYGEAERVRVVGSRSNAGLIVGLVTARLKDLLQSVEVVTPLINTTRAERRDPEAVLYQMRQHPRPPSLGGFHEVTQADYSAYALTAAVALLPDDHTGDVGERARRLLHAHPVWKPLSFIADLDETACARLLSLIVDPRWYIDVCNPDRSSRLETYLGLQPKTQAGVSLRGRRPWRYHDRCQLVMQCWKIPHLLHHMQQVFSVAGTVPQANGARGLDPRDFLWRVWGSRMGYCAETEDPSPPNPVIADLRASQFFIRFLRHCWLSEIYRDTVVAGGFPLFRAADFFRHVVEVEAFDHYIQDA